MLENFILKEGNKKILYTLVLSVFFDIFISSFLANLGYLFFIVLLFVFRNQSKYYSPKKNTLSICDGTITALDVKGKKSILHIDVSIFDKHILRAPQDGKISLISKKHGLNLNSDTYISKKLNNSITFMFNDLKITLIDGCLNMHTSLSEDNEDFSQNQKIGVFTSGKIIIEMNSLLNKNITLGQKLYAGESILI